MASEALRAGLMGYPLRSSADAPWATMTPRKAPEVPQETVGDRVRRFRRRLRVGQDQHVMTQPELAEAIGADKGYVARIETGKVAQPGREVLSRIAKALKVTMRDLDPFYYEDERPDDPTRWVVGMRGDPTLDDSTKLIIEQVMELGRQKKPTS